VRGKLRYHVHPELDDPVLVLAFAGWNDASEAATGCVQFINDSLRAVPLAELDPEEFYDFTVARPHVTLDDSGDRRIVWPSTEFRYGHLDPIEFVTGLGTEPHMRWHQFCDCVSSLAAGIGASRVVLLGAYLADVVYSRPVEVSGFARDSDVLEQLDVAPSAYEGPTGIVGVLSERLQEEGRDVLSLWACLPHYLNASPNPRGTLALLDRLGGYLGIRFDDAELRSQSEEFENRVNEIVAGDPELSDYVKQLKRRDFGQ
jgi:proteasome assembly chaperone (PAC2) family protein